ncbi:hypothetical protein ID866_3252 [Astraeus odoratus]|nr:hypothetical protein ID866_3252 [Astraeus odoratus]
MVSPANDDAELPELVRFREEWKEEVRQRRVAHQHHPPSHPSSSQSGLSQSISISDGPSGSSVSNQSAVRGLSRPGPTDASRPPAHAFKGEAQFSPTLARAVQIYRNAVRHEQDGQLDEALREYQQAFRLEPNVDRAYFWEERRQQQLTSSVVGAVGHRKTTSVGKGEADAAQDVPILKTTAEGYQASGVLAKVIAHFPGNLTFEPETECKGITLKLIPDELLLQILRNLDATAVERFAMVCRKARVLSLDSSIWRDFVHLAYKPPQIPSVDSLDAIVDSHDSNYRRVYTEQPRLRLDGVYIAICHYVRRGMSEYAWVDNMHLVTYHRYLRFFADGTVLSLLAGEEHSPQNVIPILKPTLRMKGFHVGYWQLDGSTVQITNLRSPYESPPSRYQFQMSLALHSKPLGRWNKLEILSYESVNIEGEIIPFALKHARPFWFSKVKSYPGY